MPGPVSDSYDPEFSTRANADDVKEAIGAVRGRITRMIGSNELKNIVGLAQSKDGPRKHCSLSERELRIIRFCLDRSTESI